MIVRVVALAALLLTAGSARADTYDDLGAWRSKASKPALIERYAPGERRYGELRLPKGKGPFPVAVILHGGCWMANMENPSGVAPLADALTQRGIATWSLEFRSVGDAGGGWPGTFTDVGAGIDYLRVLARTRPLDLSRVAVVGHSSGAHLALWAASRPKLKTAVAGANPLKPVAVGVIDGPGDLAAFVGPDQLVCNRPVVASLMGGTPQEKPEAYRLASPIEHLPLGVRHLFVVGDFEPAMADYMAAAEAAGDPVRTLKPVGGDHFTVLTPATRPGEETFDFLARELFAKP